MRILVTGARGQDGSYLCEQLLDKGHEVWALVRRQAVPHQPNISHIASQLNFVYGDLTDQASLEMAIQKSRPEEIYNLAAQSFVGSSWDTPAYTMAVDANGVIKLFEAVRSLDRTIRIYQASSSEMFGATGISTTHMGEDYPMRPCSPYGIAKLAAHHACRVYRESYGMFICSGILFNHESPRRGLEFVTRKVTNGLAKIASGKTKGPLQLGNLNAVRDWGYAPEYTQVMQLMLATDKPDDYVVATGEAHTVRDWVQACLDYFNLDWDAVQVNPAEKRPYDVEYLCGDYGKIKKSLGWEPKTRMKELAEIMCAADWENIHYGN